MIINGKLQNLRQASYKIILDTYLMEITFEKETENRNT